MFELLDPDVREVRMKYLSGALMKCDPDGYADHNLYSYRLKLGVKAVKKAPF